MRIWHVCGQLASWGWRSQSRPEGQLDSNRLKPSRAAEKLIRASCGLAATPRRSASRERPASEQTWHCCFAAAAACMPTACRLLCADCGFHSQLRTTCLSRQSPASHGLGFTVWRHTMISSHAASRVQKLQAASAAEGIRRNKSVRTQKGNEWHRQVFSSIFEAVVCWQGVVQGRKSGGACSFSIAMHGGKEGRALVERVHFSSGGAWNRGHLGRYAAPRMDPRALR